MRRLALSFAFALVLVGCINHKGVLRSTESMWNQGTTGWPKHQRTSPTPTPVAATSSSKARPEDVVLIFPAINDKHVLHWNALESFRIVLPRTPAALENRIPKGAGAISDLRTPDRELTEGTFQALRCGFGRTWNGTKYQPKQFLEAGFCDDGDPTAERKATIGLVDDVLDALRKEAANAGVFVVSDVRCYAAGDPRRLWCEGTGEVLSSG